MHGLSPPVSEMRKSDKVVPFIDAGWQGANILYNIEDNPLELI
jgi:hypothetical protein